MSVCFKPFAARSFAIAAPYRCVRVALATSAFAIDYMSAEILGATKWPREYP